MVRRVFVALALVLVLMCSGCREENLAKVKIIRVQPNTGTSYSLVEDERGRRYRVVDVYIGDVGDQVVIDTSGSFVVHAEGW